MLENRLIGFVPVTRAAEQFQLSARDPYGQAVYPIAANWQQFQAALICHTPDNLETLESALDRTFKENSAGVVFVVGPPGTGKTLQTLLYGFSWTQRDFQTLLRRRVDAYAMYTSVGAFDLSLLERSWRVASHASSRFLWIIDEIDQVLPNDPEATVVQQSVERFRSERLAERGHHLICVGQRVPHGLRGYPRVEVALTLDSIEVALRHKGLQHRPPNEVVDELLKTRNTGLKVVMAVAKTVPTSRQAVTDYIQLGASGRLSRLSSEARSLAADLARLRFLGLPLKAHPTQAAAFTVLTTQNLATEVGETGTWQLTDDELARAILMMSISPTDLARTFYEPLLDLIERDTRSYASAIVVLAQKPVSDLETFGRPAHGSSQQNLLVELLQIYHERIHRYITAADFDLADLAAVLLRLQMYLKEDVAGIAKVHLRTHGTSIADALAEADLSAWKAASQLSLMASDTSLTERLAAMLDDDRARAAIKRLPSQEVSVFLAIVGRFDSGRVKDLQRLLLPATPSEAATLFKEHSTNWMWGFVSEKTRLLGKGFILDTLRLLPRNELAEAIYRAPTVAKWALRHLSPDRLFQEAINTRPLNENDLAVWTTPGPVIDFLMLCRRLQITNALESNLFSAAIQEIAIGGDTRTLRLIARELHHFPGKAAPRRTLAKFLARDRTVRLDTRLYALSLLEPGAALRLIDDQLPLFARLVEVTDLEQIFWVLWEASARTRGTLRVRTVRMAAKQISARLPAPAQNDDQTLAVEGILSFLRAGDPRISGLTVDEFSTTDAISTSKLSCQIFALARLHASGIDRFDLLSHAMGRLLSTKRRWQDMSAAHRHAALAVVTEAARHLAEHRCAPKALGEMGAHVARSADQQIWDWNPAALVRLVTLTLGVDEAGRIIKTHASRWKQNLQAGHLTFDSLDLMWMTFYASERCAAAKPEARSLLYSLANQRHNLPMPYRAIAALIGRRAGFNLRDGVSNAPAGHVSDEAVVISALADIVETGDISRNNLDRLINETDANERRFFYERFHDRRRTVRTAQRLTWESAKPPTPAMTPRDYLTAGRYDLAVESARRVLARDPKERMAAKVLVAALEQLGRFDEAVEAGRKLDRSGSSEDDYDQAALIARQSVESDPTSAKNWQRFASTVKHAKRPGDAIALATSMLRKQPEIHHAVWPVCEALASVRPAAVADLLERLVEIDPLNARYWNLLGAARRKSDERTAAVEAARRAVEIDPAVDDYWYSLGRTYETIRDVPNAIEAHRRAIALGHAKAGNRLKALLVLPRANLARSQSDPVQEENDSPIPPPRK